MRPLSRLLSLSLFAVIFASGGQAWADQEGVYLEYSVSVGCPSRVQFENQVRERTALARFIDVRGPGRSFSVSASVNEALAVGHVTSRRGDEVGSAREVSSRSCEDVVSALALIVALAIDPHAVTALKLPATGAFPSESATESDETASTVQAPAPAPAKNAAQPKPTATSAGKTRSDQSSHEPLYADDFDAAESARAKPRSVAFDLGARTSGSIWFGSTTVPMAAIAGSLEAESPKATRFSPAVRLSAERSVSSTVHPSGGGQAEFATSTARFDVCPMRIALGPAVALRPCVGFEGGRLTGIGSEAGLVTRGQTSHRLWEAIDESARLQFRIASAWKAEFEAGLMQPAWHDGFFFELRDSTGSSGSRVPIIKVPVLVPRLSLGVGLRFW